MLFASINHPDLLSSIGSLADGIEARLDLFPSLSIELVKNLLLHSPLPMMLTLRNSHPEDWIQKLLELKPPFFDLDGHLPEAFLQKILQKNSPTQFILSYHNFQETPVDLEAIFQSMRHYPAYGYKIATFARSTNDALRLLLFAKKHPRVSAICMGEKGSFARVLGPLAGNLIDYASLSEKQSTAPGQISLSDLIHIYRYPSLNTRTQLFGLIGDPVANSQGHLYHNAVFAKQHLNAVYVKMDVKPEELTTFFPLAREMGFQGLSVTMPLKEKVFPFLDEIDPRAKAMGAVNTLVFKKDRLFGTNTDGTAALDVIEKRGAIRDKQLVLLGAGGAARAIAFEAKQRGAHVCILNRTVQKAKELALAVGCEAGGLADMPAHYDALIHCSSVPIDPGKILPQALVMDITYFPKETPLLEKANQLGCKTIYGEEMFLNQAAAQAAIFTKRTSPPMYIGRHLLKGNVLKDLCKQFGHSIALLADEHLLTSHAKPLAETLNAQIFPIPSGEKAKTRATKQAIEDQLLQAGYGRDAVLIALGGGVTTDLVGFIASTYLRGVPLILIPTTLLAMVDAAIGGKTAIDTPFGKNLIGTFYQPKAIIIDLETLSTLPEKEWVNGLAEILKIGLIYDSALLKLEKEEQIHRAIQAKVAIVEQDPLESGLRRILNFGHTIAHALETLSNYALSHGEAVMIGCLTEAHLSWHLGYLPEQEFLQIAALYAPFTFLKLPANYDRKALLKALFFDKKRAHGALRIVLIDQIGHALPFDEKYCRPVSEDQLQESLNWMEANYG